jgi:hypothetical protein
MNISIIVVTLGNYAVEIAGAGESMDEASYLRLAITDISSGLNFPYHYTWKDQPDIIWTGITPQAHRAIVKMVHAWLHGNRFGLGVDEYLMQLFPDGI